MSTLAVNDAGDVMAFDGKDWKPATVAQNDRGERMAFDGKDWQRLGEAPSIGRQALDMAGSVGGAVADGVNTGVNYLGTQAAKVAGGVAGVPRMLGDMATLATSGTKGAVRPADLGLLGTIGQFGKNMPTGEEMTRAFFDKTGAPEVNLEGNIPGGKIIDAGVQGAISVPMMGGATIPALIAGMGGGAGSEAAGQIAEEYAPTYEIPARIGGALVGAGGATLATDAVRKAGGALKALGEPLTKGGRDSIVGRSLVKQSADPATAIPRMENYSTPVPGFQIPAGKASRDSGLMAVEEVASARVPAMRATVDNNNAVLTGEITKAQAGLPPAEIAGETIQKSLRTRFDALDRTRSNVSSPYYDAARNSSTPIDPTGVRGAVAAAVDDTVGDPQALMKKVQGYLADPKSETPKGMMAVRDAIGALQDNPMLDKYSKGLLKQAKSEVDTALAAVPEEAQARALFQQHSKPLEPFDKKLGNKNVADAIAKDRFGGDFLMPAEKVPSQFMKPGALSAPMMQKFMTANGGDIKSIEAMRAYVLEDFKKAASSKVAGDAAGNPRLTANGAAEWLSKNKGAASNVLTPDQVKALESVERALKDQAATIPGRTGSPTFDRLATENIIGAIVSPKFADAPILSPINKALGLVYGGANEATMNRLFEVIQDPKVAAALMKKATPGNVNMVAPMLERITQGAAVPAGRAPQ